jgi:hypothetical protein
MGDGLNVYSEFKGNEKLRCHSGRIPCCGGPHDLSGGLVRHSKQQLAAALVGNGYAVSL